MSAPDLTVVREAIPARARLLIYVAFTLLVIGVGAVQVGYAAIPGGVQPDWLTVALAVLLYLSAPVAIIAAVNVKPDAVLLEADPVPLDRGELDGRDL